MTLQRWLSVGVLLGASISEYVLYHTLKPIISNPVKDDQGFIMLFALGLGMIVTSVLGCIFGVGGLVASFGTAADGAGRFKIRDNWVARSFLPKVSSDQEVSWCVVSTDTAALVFARIFDTLIMGAGILLVALGLWYHPVGTAVAAGIVVALAAFFVSLFAVASATGPRQKIAKGVLTLYVLGIGILGLSLIDWTGMYKAATVVAPTVIMHPIAWAVVVVALFAAGFTLLMKNEKVHSTLCPRTRALKTEEAPASQ